MADTVSRIPPSSLDAEQSILGAMLLSESCVFQAAERLKERDFYSENHRQIWRVMMELSAVGKPIDLVTVTEKLEQARPLTLEEVSYLSDLTIRVPSTRNISSYIDIVREKSLLRSIIDIASEMSDMAYGLDMPAREIISVAGDKIYRLADGQDERTLIHISKALVESYEVMLRASQSKDGLMGISTGFPLMDKTLSGLQGGQLIVVAGRPGMGKSSFANNIAEHVGIRLDLPVAIFNLEMTAEQLASRMLCSGAMVDSQRARTGALTEEDTYKLADALVPLQGSKIYIDDSPVIGPTEILAKLRRLRQQTGPIGLVVIDYLQLMETGRATENRQQEISKLTRSIKIMAKDLNVPVVLLSQLSRASEKRENKRPMLSDLRESGSIEQDADVVLFLHRESYYHDDVPEGAGDAQIIIAKQRSGPTRTIDVMWRGEQTKYMEIDFAREE